MTLRAVKTGNPEDRARSALQRMGRADTDRLAAELDYGAALNEIRAQHESDKAFGRAVKDAGLSEYVESQLATVRTVQITRDARAACMWLAENELTVRQMIKDGTNATTARGLRKQWQNAQTVKDTPKQVSQPVQSVALDPKSSDDIRQQVDTMAKAVREIQSGLDHWSGWMREFEKTGNPDALKEADVWIQWISVRKAELSDAAEDAYWTSHEMVGGEI